MTFSNLRINLKYWFIGLVMISILLGLIWFDVLSDFNDAEIQAKIEKNLSAELPITVSELIPNATVFCVLPPYIKADSISSFLSADQLIYLDRRINSFIGSGDHVWWLVSLNNNQSIQAHRMGGFARPAFKLGKCLNQQEAVISINKKDGYIFFNFSKGE